jgi:transcriptional regulator with GAF, ATPase, and Fis domain
MLIEFAVKMEIQSIGREFFAVPAVSAASHRLLEDVCRICDAERAAVWLISEDGGTLQGAANFGGSEGIIEHIDVPAVGSLIGMVASTGIGMCFGSEDPYNRAVDAQTGTSTRAMVAVPLHLDGKLIGVLSAINPRDRAAFRRSDLEELSWRVYLLGLVVADLITKQL